jgi:hypothetical protein
MFLNWDGRKILETVSKKYLWEWGLALNMYEHGLQWRSLMRIVLNLRVP